MSMSSPVVIQCSNCYIEFPSEIYMYVDRSMDRDAIGAVFRGTFNYKHCTQCDNEGHVRFPVQFADSAINEQATFIYLLDNKVPHKYGPIENTETYIPLKVTMKGFTVKEITRDNCSETVLYSNNDIIEKLISWGEEIDVFPDQPTEGHIEMALKKGIISEDEADSIRLVDFEKILYKLIQQDSEYDNPYSYCPEMEFTQEEEDAIQIAIRIQHSVNNNQTGKRLEGLSIEKETFTSGGDIDAKQRLIDVIAAMKGRWRKILLPLVNQIWQRFTVCFHTAKKLLEDKEKVLSFMEKVLNKIKKCDNKLDRILNDLEILLRLIKAWVNGNYKEVPAITIVSIIAALIYLVTPVDIIPDVIPVIGYIDDIAVIMFVVNSIRKDLDEFRGWEQGTKMSI